MTKKCNPGIGAVPVNVIMIVLQIGPTYQTCINFAEKLMVLRCYDHNLITDRKRDFEFYPVCFQWHFMKMQL